MDPSGAASLGSAGSCRAIRFPIQTRWARRHSMEANFIDKRRTALFLTEEHEIER